jgi:uncharacterized Zn finger protein (UPF0148 family)
MLTCPMCKKPLPSGTTPCPRCRADLTLLVDFMSNLDEHLIKADAAMKAGELGEAVWAYMNVLETDPEHPVAVRQIRQVATAVRQFDEARRTSHRTMFLFGIGVVLAFLLLLGGMFAGGFWLGKHFTGFRITPTQEAK